MSLSLRSPTLSSNRIRKLEKLEMSTFRPDLHQRRNPISTEKVAFAMPGNLRDWLVQHHWRHTESAPPSATTLWAVKPSISQILDEFSTGLLEAYGCGQPPAANADATRRHIAIVRSVIRTTKWLRDFVESMARGGLMRSRIDIHHTAFERTGPSIPGGESFWGQLLGAEDLLLILAELHTNLQGPFRHCWLAEYNRNLPPRDALQHHLLVAYINALLLFLDDYFEDFFLNATKQEVEYKPMYRRVDTAAPTNKPSPRQGGRGAPVHHQSVEAAMADDSVSLTKFHEMINKPRPGPGVQTSGPATTVRTTASRTTSAPAPIPNQRGRGVGLRGRGVVARGRGSTSRGRGGYRRRRADDSDSSSEEITTSEDEEEETSSGDDESSDCSDSGSDSSSSTEGEAAPSSSESDKPTATGARRGRYSTARKIRGGR